MSGAAHLLDDIARLMGAAREQGVTDEVLIAVLLEIIEAIRQGADLGRRPHARQP